MAKEISFNRDAREKLRAGVDAMANAVPNRAMFDKCDVSAFIGQSDSQDWTSDSATNN